jgi:phosphate/sulfate permease
MQIAGIFEFMGAIVLGGEVTKTIATDIARVEYFNNAPEVRPGGERPSVKAVRMHRPC